MTSRNKREGHYAGKVATRHRRTAHRFASLRPWNAPVIYIAGAGAPLRATFDENGRVTVRPIP